MEDIEARGPLVTLADGRQVPRLPGLRRWLWAEDADLTHLDSGMREAQRFIGTIGLRWARDHGALPPHVLGHCGYAVVPWHRGRGHATAALAALLPLARVHGLPFIELTTDPDNLASQQVMLRNGAVLVGPFDKGPTYGHALARIFHQGRELALDLRGQRCSQSKDQLGPPQVRSTPAASPWRALGRAPLVAKADGPWRLPSRAHASHHGAPRASPW